MPLTYIIPIGPYGSGKTTLRTQMQNGDYSLLTKFNLLNNNDVYFMSTCRDEVFYQVRILEKNSVNKTRRILFDKFEQFFQEIIDLCAQDSKDVSVSQKNIVVYFDSTNAKLGNRRDLCKRITPDNILLINFRCSNVQTLLSRTLNRIEHPTFPKEEESQRKNIEKVLPFIEYGNRNEFEVVGISSDNVYIENICF